MQLFFVTAAAATGELSHMRPFEGRRVSSIELEGNRVTHAYIILRELETSVDGPLHVSTLSADLQRLDNLDIFSSIHVRAEPDSPNSISLTIQVREIPYAVPYISYEVSDQDGWSFGPAVKSVNMMGHNVFVAGYALFGGTTTYLLDLTAPWIAANHLSLELDVNRIERDNELDDFDETAFEFTPRVGTYIGAAGRASVLLSYLQIESDTPGHTLSLSNRDRLFRLGGSLGYDSRDSWGDPHSGWLNEIELIKTGGPFPGKADFWTTHLDLRRFQPLGDQTAVLAGLLSLQSGHRGSTLPEYETIISAARTPSGVRGRRSRAFPARAQSAAADSRISAARGAFPRVCRPRPPRRLGLSGALFADSGIAWNDRDEFGLSRFKSGVGVGLRLLMPAVDMTRFDVGLSEDGDVVFHFAVFSKMEAQRLRRR